MKQIICAFILLILVSSIGGLFVELLTLPFIKGMILFFVWFVALMYCACQLSFDKHNT
jgi:hypothetical protein